MNNQSKASLPLPSFKTGLGSLYEGDCIELLRKLADDSIDLVFADPPFNLGKKYVSKINDDIAETEYLSWCKVWLAELCRVLSPGGALFVYNLPKWNLALGGFLIEKLTFRHWITVDMKFSLPIQKRLYPANYSLLYYIKGKKPKIFHPDRVPLRTCRHCGGELQDYGGYKDKMNPAGVNLSDVWSDIPPVRHQKYKDRKANQLSLKLLDRVLSIASDEGSLVLDPFGGSGTTFVAAELLRRRWIGMELQCSEILQRFQDLESERVHLSKIHRNKNVLFTMESLEKRCKFGHRSDCYQTDLSVKKAKERGYIPSLTDGDDLPLFKAS